MKKVHFSIAFFLLLHSTAFTQRLNSDSINIKRDIQFLSSDDLEGRFPGSKGEAKAATYIWTQLSTVGCKSFYKNGLQEFSKEMNSKQGNYILKGCNVVGYIQGKKNPNDYIVIGAHFDHLGMGGVGSGSRMPDTIAVHNGADDNASGVSAMLECARILSKENLDCSIIFVAFSAEEKGLIGSHFFINNPPVSKERIKAMINFDMVGRLDSVLTLQGTSTALEFDSLFTPFYSKQPFQLKRIPGGYGPSDQTSFYAEKIPVLYFYTSTHEQYHTPYDDWELINMKGIADITNFAVDLISTLANTSQSLTYQAIGSKTNMTQNMKAVLGIMPDHTSVEGLKINAVRPGQAAEKGGILKGDIIIGIQGKKVENIESYMKLMSEYAKGDSISIDVLRNGTKHILTINL